MTVKQRARYMAELESMTDAALFEESRYQLLASARKRLDKTSSSHRACDLIYDEWSHRNKIDQYTAARASLMEFMNLV